MAATSAKVAKVGMSLALARTSLTLAEKARAGTSLAADGLRVLRRLVTQGPLWARLMVLFGTLLVLMSAGTLVTVKGLSQRYESVVARADLIAPDARERSQRSNRTTISGPLNFLLIGSDFRSRTPGAGQRADTIIVVHVPASLDRAYLISIPRDLLVEIPAYPPTGFGGGEDRINAAFQRGGGGLGGAQLLSTTLTRLIGIRFNGAAIINFEGFRKAVDVLGGVYMCVDQQVPSNHLGVDRNGKIIDVYADEDGRIQGLPPGGQPYMFEEGCRRMTGQLALDYARIRYGLPRGDYDRQQHQQQFLKAVFQEALTAGIVTNPLKFDEFLRSVGTALTVDTGEVGLTNMAFGLRNVMPSTLVGLKVPSYPETIDGTAYVLPDGDAPSLYHAIRADRLQDWVAANPTWAQPI